jgi:hypothetical protein
LDTVVVTTRGPAVTVTRASAGTVTVTRPTELEITDLELDSSLH